MNNFGDYLKELREVRGYGLNELAAKANVSSALISRVENKKRNAPKTATLNVLSDVLNVSQSEMLFIAGQKEIIEVVDNILFSEVALKYMTEEEKDMVQKRINKTTKINISQLINKKKDGRELTSNEISFFINGLSNKIICEDQAIDFLLLCITENISEKELIAFKNKLNK